MLQSSVLLHEGFHLLQHLVELDRRRDEGSVAGTIGKRLRLFGLQFGGGAAVNASDYGHYMIVKITEFDGKMGEIDVLSNK